ncbi:hypothetical protein HMI54_000316 [Coelomomyces lativittatus]|nr:hypothetical protein HMI54_000316 [Coelomomyces lativittatus]
MVANSLSLPYITFFVIDFLISTTSIDKPFYEKYRSLKIALNQHPRSSPFLFTSHKRPFPLSSSFTSGVTQDPKRMKREEIEPQGSGGHPSS